MNCARQLTMIHQRGLTRIGHKRMNGLNQERTFGEINRNVCRLTTMAG
jgi:hypothetical protein